MSDFFKKMKSVFVEPTGGDESTNQESTKEQKEKESSEQTVANTKTSDSATGTTSHNYQIENISGQQSDQFYKVLFDALEKNNQAGFDYLEFKKALQSLESIVVDEKTRFLSAFAGAQASGATAQQLASSAESYLSILNTESDNFKNAVEVQRTKQISNRENEVKQLTNLISGKKDQIQKLQAEIEEHSKMLSALDNEIKTAQSKIETTKADFSVTYDGLVKKIRDDVDRIKTYLTTN